MFFSSFSTIHLYPFMYPYVRHLFTGKHNTGDVKLAFVFGFSFLSCWQLTLSIIYHHLYSWIHPSVTCSRASMILVTSSSLSASFVAAFNAELLPSRNLFVHSSRRALWRNTCEAQMWRKIFFKPVFLAMGADALPGIGGDEVGLAKAIN